MRRDFTTRRQIHDHVLEEEMEWRDGRWGFDGRSLSSSSSSPFSSSSPALSVQFLEDVEDAQEFEEEFAVSAFETLSARIRW